MVETKYMYATVTLTFQPQTSVSCETRKLIQVQSYFKMYEDVKAHTSKS